MNYSLQIDDNKQTTEVLIQLLKLWNITTRSSLSTSAAMAILGTGLFES
jgi:hypothetical protein